MTYQNKKGFQSIWAQTHRWWWSKWNTDCFATKDYFSFNKQFVVRSTTFHQHLPINFAYIRRRVSFSFCLAWYYLTFQRSSQPFHRNRNSTNAFVYFCLIFLTSWSFGRIWVCYVWAYLKFFSEFQWAFLHLRFSFFRCLRKRWLNGKSLPLISVFQIVKECNLGSIWAYQTRQD